MSISKEELRQINDALPSASASQPRSFLSRLFVKLARLLCAPLLQPLIEQQELTIRSLAPAVDKSTQQIESITAVATSIQLVQKTVAGLEQSVKTLQRSGDELSCEQQALRSTIDTLTREKESIEQHLASLQATYDSVSSQASLVQEMRCLMRDIQRDHTALADAIARQQTSLSR